MLILVGKGGILAVQPKGMKMDEVSQKRWEALSGTVAKDYSPFCSETDNRREQSNVFTCP